MSGASSGHFPTQLTGFRGRFLTPSGEIRHGLIELAGSRIRCVQEQLDGLQARHAQEQSAGPQVRDVQEQSAGPTGQDSARCVLTSAPDLGPSGSATGSGGGAIRFEVKLQVGSVSAEERTTSAIDAELVLMPGFVDAHTHLIGFGLAAGRPNLHGAVSRDEALEKLSKWLQAYPGTDPVIAEGWDESNWGEDGLTGADLDRLAAGRPIAARRVCGHISAFNREAIEVLGRDWEGLDPAAGVAREGVSLEIGRLWAPSPPQRAEAVRVAQEEAFRLGITSAHEMGDAICFRAFGEADRAGLLDLRIHHYFHSQCDDAVQGAGLTPGAGSEHLRVAGMKYFLDGSIGARTAAVRTPYPGAEPDAEPGAEPGAEPDAEPGAEPDAEPDSGRHIAGWTSSGSLDGARSEARSETRGWLLWNTEELLDAWRRHFSLGWPVAAHAIGDRAAEQAIGVLETLAAEGLSLDFRLEHGEMLPADLLARAQALGIGISMQPNFTANWQGEGGLYEQVLGREWADSLNPYRSVFRTGRLIFGSDTMPMDPIYGMGGALRHPDPEQRLTAAEAHAAYTRAGAMAVPSPFGRSSIEEGEFADWILVSGVPREWNRIEDWASLQVRATWIGGKCVYWDPALRAEPGHEAEGGS